MDGAAGEERAWDPALDGEGGAAGMAICDATAEHLGPAGETKECATGGVSVGGKGGDGGPQDGTTPAGDGEDGTLVYEMVSTSSLGGAGEGATVCSNGADGAHGADGEHGAGAISAGTISASGYAGGDGAPGMSGLPGQAGGGGGGAKGGLSINCQGGRLYGSRGGQGGHSLGIAFQGSTPPVGGEPVIEPLLAGPGGAGGDGNTTANGGKGADGVAAGCWDFAANAACGG